MSGQQPKKIKQSFWKTLRLAWKPYKRLFSYAMPYKSRLITGLSCGFLTGIISSFLPIVIAKVTGFIFHGAAPGPSAIMANPALLQTGMKITSLSLIGYCLLIPAVMTVRCLFDYADTYYMNWVSNKVLTDIRNELFGKMLSHSLNFFNKIQSGFLVSRITNDSRMMQTALSTVSSDVLKQPVTIISGVAVLLYMDWKFTIVTLVLFPSCIIPLRLYGKRARKAVKNEQEELGQMLVTMQETFGGIRIVKSFVREEQQKKSFERSNRIQFDAAMRILRATQSIGPLVETIAAIGVGLALLYVYLDNLPAAKFIALISGIFILYEPIKTLSRIHVVMQQSIQATDEIFRILDSTPAILDQPNAVAIPHAQGGLEFDHVTFRYESGVEDALKDFSLRIEPGRSYALVGASGAGKSTILSLLLRLYDPTAGAIYIDGRDLRSITQSSLRQQIGLVSQDTFLFHDTITSNIRFGRLDATDEEIRAAAVTAYAHDFIMAQPKGYDTIVGDKGCLLSGGQQQRIAIARALLKDAPVLLLDEATSALDSESEQQIQIALDHLAKGRTVIAIAHRLSTILSADQIVVMESGHIKEIGTHAELLEKSGYYRRLYDLQFNRNPEEPGAEVEMLETASA